MQAYTDILPPSAVTAAAALPFLSSTSRNLVVAKTNLLQIFELSTFPLRDNRSDVTNGTQAEDLSPERLRLVGEYLLSGNVTSLAGVKLIRSRSGGHALLVATEYAKFSVVEWDPIAHNLSTVSIHLYEKEQLPGSPWGPELSRCPSFLTVDPGNKCAALKFGQRDLAIVPFRQPEDDDLADDGYDEDMDGSREQSAKTLGEGQSEETAFSSSFVLPLTALDTSLVYPADLAFLYEYREPTLGVLSSSAGSALSLMRKDVMTYTAFTLDLEQKARTPLLSVSKLPSDLFRIVPLPLPVGGSLLVGCNELIHIDQAGKTHAIAVNEFARQASQYPMMDHSHLGLRLENCVVTTLRTGHGDLLLSLADGSLAILTFRMDGRTVSSLGVTKIASEQGGNLVGATASCAATLAPNLIFVGSDDTDAVLLSLTSSSVPATKKRPQADVRDDEQDSDENFDDEDDDDDLYGNGNAKAKKAATSAQALIPIDQLVVTVLDRLPNFAAQTDPALGRGQDQGTSFLEIGISTGRGESAGVSLLRHGLAIEQGQTLGFESVQNAWSVRAVAASDQLKTQHDTHMIFSHKYEDGTESSSIHSVTDTGLENLVNSDFDTESATHGVGLVQHGSRIIQVLAGQLKCYDPALDFPQIIPMSDEDSDEELLIKQCSFSNDYVLVTREDQSAVIFKANKQGELEALDEDEGVASTKWASGCLYETASAQTFALLLSAEGSVQIFELPNLAKPIVRFDGFPHLPPFIAPDYHARRMEARATLQEIRLTSFGESDPHELYLLIRTDTDEVVVYKAYTYPHKSTKAVLGESLRWRKMASFAGPADLEDEATVEQSPLASQKLEVLPFKDGRSAVFVSGQPPRLITKQLHGSPGAVAILNKDARSIRPCNHPSNPQAYLAVGQSGAVRMARFPDALYFPASGWSARQCKVGVEIDSISYHHKSGYYVTGTNTLKPFRLPEDDWHPEWAKEPEYEFKPRIPQGSVRLFDPVTMTFVDEFAFSTDEMVLCVRALSMEISENSHDRKLMIAAGTTMIRGEDNPSMGAIYIFEIVEVVPEPSKPETHVKLRRVAREEMRGAVTAISEIGTQGFLLHAQGQRCMVRGLKEDNSILPVAFQDVQIYVKVIKNLEGTGLALVGDVAKGLWLVGFASEPYRMLQFGKTSTQMEVLAAEFLPDGKQLFPLAADADCNLHVFEYNPEHPKSLAGQRLIHKSTFFTGHFPVSLDLVPSLTAMSVAEPDQDTEMEGAPNSGAGGGPRHHVLLTSQSGAVGLLTPLDEATYRRLGALQTHLSNVLDHACSLNPRAYRAIDAEGFGSRGILDGNILGRWKELGSQRKHEALARVGTSRWELIRDLDTIDGVGIGYV